MADLIFKGTQLSGNVEKPKVGIEKKEVGKLSNWDSQIAPIMDDYPKVKEIINYKDSKPIMRAVNGRYDNVMSQLKEDDPKAYDNFKKFKNSSWAVANELKKIETGEFNYDTFIKHKKDATVYFNGIADSYKYDKNKRFAMTPDAQMMTREQYEKWDQEPSVSKNKSSTSAKVVYNNEIFKNLVADYETPNVSSSYKKLNNINEYYKDKGVELIQPITKSWVATSLQRIDVKKPDADKDAAALNMNMDLLKHVGKYKTTGDPDLARGDQETANSILKQLRGKDKSEQLELLKANSAKINSLSGRMGYYGNASIYNKYKNGYIGKTLDYYPQSKDKDRGDYFNQTQENGVIDRTIDNFKQFRKVDEDIRLQTLTLTNQNWKTISNRFGYDLKKPQFELAMNELVDDKGNIVSYKKWKKSMSSISDPSKYGYTPGGSPAFGSTFKNIKEKGIRNTAALTQIYNQNDDDVTLGEYVNPGHWIFGKGNEERREDQFISIYNNLKRSYKKNFDSVKSKTVYNATLLDAGFGNERNQAMEYRGVNLAVDKNMRLKQTEGPKQENISKVFGMLFDEMGNVDKENVTLFSNKDIKSGLNAVQTSDLKEQRKKNDDVLKNFLKQDNENVTMTFFRNTNAPNQSAYQFYNTKTKESMMVYAPKSMLGKNGIKEDLFTKTGKDPLDFTFKAKGELTMPKLNDKNGKPAYDSAALKYDKENDSYIGEIWDYNSEGNLKKKVYEIPYASAISINDAQKTFLNFLGEYRNDKQ
jgi:hypothetical protein